MQSLLFKWINNTEQEDAHGVKWLLKHTQTYTTHKYTHNKHTTNNDALCMTPSKTNEKKKLFSAWFPTLSFFFLSLSLSIPLIVLILLKTNSDRCRKCVNATKQRSIKRGREREKKAVRSERRIQRLRRAMATMKEQITDESILMNENHLERREKTAELWQQWREKK